MGQIAILGYVGILTIQIFSDYGEPVVLVGGAAVIGLLALVMVGMARANPLLAWQVGRDPTHYVEQTWQFSDEGVHFKSEHADSQNTWGTFVKAREDEKFYFLFLNKQIYNVIPKRAVASAADETRLRDLLRRKIAKWI